MCIRDRDISLVDPHLHADAAEGGLGLTEAVVDVGPQGMQRNPTLAVRLPSGHLGSTQAARALHADTEGAGLLYGLDGTLHGPAERHPAGELIADALGNKSGIEFRLLDLLDIELNSIVQTSDLFDLLLQAVGFGSTTANHDAREGGCLLYTSDAAD